MADIDPAALYRELAPAVLGYLRTQSVEDPYETLGEVFFQVTRDLPRFAGDAAAARRWVFTIAHHRVVDDARRRARRPRTTDRHPDRDLDRDPDRDLWDASVPIAEPPEPFDDELLRAVQALTPDQREVIALRFVADLSLDQVATITERPVGAVKALQHRALANLRQAVSCAAL